MLKQLTNILQKIRNVENLDLYITVAISIVVGLLGLIGLASFEILSAAVLAILALMAGSLLSNRRSMTDIKKVADQLDSEIKSLKLATISFTNPSLLLFRRDIPNLTKDFQNATRISILGASLHSTTITYYSEFEQALKRGASLRVLVCEPFPSLLSMMVFRTYTIKDPKILKRSIQDHISLIKKLKASNPNGNCDSRTIPLVISYGMIIFEYPDGMSMIYVKLMPFRTPGAEYPVFAVSKRDNREWFDFFFNQYDMMWESGT